AEAQPILGDVEIGLVEAQWLDQFGVIGEDVAHLVGNRAIDVEARLDEDQLGAAASGADRRHRRAYAELPRFVRCRGDDSAMAAADRDRLALERRIVALLD